MQQPAISNDENRKFTPAVIFEVCIQTCKRHRLYWPTATFNRCRCAWELANRCDTLFIYLFICCWFFLLGLDIKPPLANVFFPPAGFNRGSHSNLPPFCSCKQDTQKNQGSVQLCFAIHKHVHRWRHSEKHFFLLNFYNVKVVFKSNYFTLTRGKKKWNWKNLA